MNRSTRRLATVVAVVVVGLGVLGTYSYGQDYAVHRGFVPVALLPHARTGRAVDVSFFSRALDRRTDYIAYLPPGYTPGRRYPVYYLLHGMPGHPAEFLTVAHLGTRLDNLISTHHARPMILVFPDGRINGRDYSDSEWANTPTGHYEGYVMNVVHNVDARFSTLHGRADRVIGGFSAGAYGALNIALHHLGVFASVQVWSGYFTQTRSGVFAHADRATLAANSPYDEAARVASQIRRRGLRVSLYVGRSDPDSAQQPTMVARLRAVGAHVSAATYPGGHDWALWISEMDSMLRLASRDLGSPPRPVHTTVPSAARAPAPARAPAVAPLRHADRHGLRVPLYVALLLALVAGALINLGFVAQHRAADRHASDRSPLLACARDPVWLAGQLVGWAGWLASIAAVALAPLTLVQAFAAGSLALSTPLAARLFGARVTRTQLVAVALVAASLSVLAIGGAEHGSRVSSGVLIAVALAGGGLIAVLYRTGWRGGRAIAAGIGYGIADAAVKADAIAVHHGGLAALVSGWTILAAAATLGGFVSFQAALRRDDAVSAIALMNTFATVVAIALGVGAFAETLGRSAAATTVDFAAIAVLLACVRPLARGQESLTAEDATGAGPPPLASAGSRTSPEGHSRRPAAAALGAPPAAIMAAVAASGLLYLLYTHAWLDAGPRVPDALPLLALAGFSAQPVARVAVCFLLCGAVLGATFSTLRPGTRAVLVALVAAATLLVASDVSFALTRNLSLAPVLVHLNPGLGPWLEAALLVAGDILVDALRSLSRARLSHRTIAIKEITA